MKNLNNKYIKTIRLYIVEIGGDFTNLHIETFLNKLNNSVVPGLLSLNKSLKQLNLEKELRFNNTIINCLNSITQKSNIELIINNICNSIVELEEGEQC